MLKVENLKIKKDFNHTIQQDVFHLIGMINDTEAVINTYETLEEAQAARIAIKSLVRIHKETTKDEQ